MQREYRQVDPLSPYLFIICDVVMAILLRNNYNIKGIKISDTKFLISRYADEIIKCGNNYLDDRRIRIDNYFWNDVVNIFWNNC